MKKTFWKKFTEKRMKCLGYKENGWHKVVKNRLKIWKKRGVFFDKNKYKNMKKIDYKL